MDEYENPEGLGRWINSKLGCMYEGEFKFGMFHGVGRYIWNTRDIKLSDNVYGMEYYIGSWVNGKREGVGEQ